MSNVFTITETTSWMESARETRFLYVSKYTISIVIILVILLFHVLAGYFLILHLRMRGLNLNSYCSSQTSRRAWPSVIDATS